MKNLLKIRDAVSGEADTISALVDEAYGKYVARLGRPPLPMCDDYQALIAEGVVSVLADGAASHGPRLTDCRGRLRVVPWKRAQAPANDNEGRAP